MTTGFNSDSDVVTTGIGEPELVHLPRHVLDRRDLQVDGVGDGNHGDDFLGGHEHDSDLGVALVSVEDGFDVDAAAASLLGEAMVAEQAAATVPRLSRSPGRRLGSRRE